MRLVLAALFVTQLLLACVSAPSLNQPFSDVHDLSHLAGTYENVGDPKGYLTKLLWPGSDEVFLIGKLAVRHDEAKSVRVTVTSRVIVVEAIGNGCIIGTRTFTDGKEFELTEGRVLLRKESAVLQPGGGIGPSYDKAEIGLDTKGDGKFRVTGAFAGLLIGFIPIAAYEQRDVRFARLPDAGVLTPCER